MFQSIAAREYLLQDGKGGFLKHVYTNHTQLPTLKKTVEHYSAGEVKAILREVKELFDAELKKSFFVRLFWQNADQKMKDDLLLSYWLHHVRKSKKVANVEYGKDWLDEPFFKFSFEDLVKNKRLRNMWRPKRFFRSWVRWMCKHQRGIRFDNVHLVMDWVSGREIFSIHWDNHCPKPWSLNGIKHLLFDDIRS